MASFNPKDYTLEQWIQSCIMCTIDYSKADILWEDGYFDKAQDTKKSDWTMPVLDSDGYFSQEMALKYEDALNPYVNNEYTIEQKGDAIYRLEYIIDLILER